MTIQPFILGGGFSGLAIARALAGKASPIYGTTRSPEKFEAIAQAGVEPLLFDRALTAEVAEALRRTTHLFVTAGPGASGDPLLAVMPDLRAAMPALDWACYLSTVGVYGDRQGGWVDETAECRPRPGRSDNRLVVEQAWADAAGRAGVPLAILRLSGIYGPGRNAFVNLANGAAKRIIKPGQVFNRIHVADIGAAAVHLAERGIGGVFNVTDDEPSPPQDVVTFAAGLMGVEPPPETAFEAAGMSPMALSFWGEVKRVSNAKLKAAGFSFAYPDYRTALARMWRDDDWR